MVFADVLYTDKKGFKAPSEAVHEAGYPRIRVLVIEGDRNVWKEKRSGGGTCDGTERALVGKDIEEMEMVPRIVHVMRYVINEKWKEKSS